LIKVLLADDHKIITEGISNLLADQKDIFVSAICQNGQEVLNKLSEENFDLLLLDIDMPIMNGLECAQKVLSENNNQKLAMLTMHAEKGIIQKVIEFGAKGYFLKTIDKIELLHAIRTIASGGEYFPADVTKSLIRKKGINANAAQSSVVSLLSSREIEILKLVAQGMSNKEIADKLFISHRTVDTHRTNLMRKIEVNNVAGMVRFAFLNSLVD